MLHKPPGYIEGFTICGGIFTVGMVLQLILGKIVPEVYCFPVNAIFGGLFLLFLLMFHLISKKQKGLQWFAGHTAAVTALCSLLLLMIIMGFTRQLPPAIGLGQAQPLHIRTGFMQMTVSWHFVLMMLYVLWILGLTILKRLSRFKWKDTGFMLNHVGLFIALFCAILGSSDLQRLRMTVPLNTPEWRATNEKNEMVELPLAIELKSFTIDEFPPKLMLLDNITGEALPRKKPKNVSIETSPKNVELLDWKLEITAWLPFAACIHNRDTLNFVEYYGEGATSALYVKAHNVKDNTRKEGWVSCGNFMFHFASLRLNDEVSLIMPEREPKRYVSDVTVYTQGEKIKEALIEVNKPLYIEGWKIYQLSYDVTRGKWSRHSVFELVRDPWLPLVYAGIGMMLVGALFLFISAPNKT